MKAVSGVISMRDNSRIPESIRDEIPNELSDMQVAGIEIADVDESCRLYGPPGCGKSTQSSIRSAVRAHDESLSPREMTVVTYRKSLAGAVRDNMQEWGIFDDNDDDDFKFWTTIHAAASRATDFHDRFSDDPDDHEGMVNDSEMYHFCNELSIQKKPEKPWYETRWTVFYDLYTYAKNNLLDLGEYRNVDSSLLTPIENDLLADKKLNAFNEEWGATSAEDVAQMWESYKREHNCYDFYQQLTAALSRSLPPMKHVVIDEYHDATPLMAAVTERWVEHADVAIVAGDPDQVVNAYAGASPGFFEEIDSRVNENMPVVHLHESFRVPEEHYQAAARVLSEQRTPPKLTTSGAGMLNEWRNQRFESQKDGWNTPNADVQGSPAHLWSEFGQDIMFLARTQRRCDAVCASLDEHGVLYQSQPGVGREWDEWLDLIHVLLLLSNVTPPPEDAGENQTLTSRDRGELQNYSLSAEQAKLLVRYTSGHLQDGLEEKLQAVHGSDEVSLEEIDNVVNDKFWLRYTNGFDSIPVLTGLSDDEKRVLQAVTERYGDEIPATLNDVGTRVLTMHASKGAEASNVVVYDGITRTIKNSIERSRELAKNEARTWYVALTRAKNRLHIVRDGFNGEQYLPDGLCKSAYHAARSQRGVEQ